VNPQDLPVADRRFFVELHKEGYQVRRYHKDNASAVEPTKQQALAKAREFARNASTKNKRAQVKVRKNGAFQRVEDYVDGKPVSD
jgi:hypothetical protein